MVQPNLGLTPINYEYIDEQPTPPRKIKKTVPSNDGGWEDRTFIRIPVGEHKISELEIWCRSYYYEPRYLGPWFKVSGYIILDEKTYTHWKLCE
jgi:hypothetical protein